MLRLVDRIWRPQSSTVLPTGRSYDFREPGCRPFYLFVVFDRESTDGKLGGVTGSTFESDNIV